MRPEAAAVTLTFADSLRFHFLFSFFVFWWRLFFQRGLNIIVGHTRSCDVTVVNKKTNTGCRLLLQNPTKNGYFCFILQLLSLLWQNIDQNVNVFVLNLSLGEYLVVRETKRLTSFPEVEITQHLLTCAPIQLFVIDLTSERSHQPKRIIMRKAVLMMSSSFCALHQPVNFDPRNTLQWYDCDKFN